MEMLRRYIKTTTGMESAVMRLVFIRVGSDVRRSEGGLNMHCMHKGELTFTCR